MSDSKVFDPDPKKYIWEGKRVTWQEYGRKRAEAIAAEIAVALESVVGHEMTGFDEELYQSKDFIPVVMENLLGIDGAAKMHQQVAEITRFKAMVEDWFMDRPWCASVIHALDEKIEQVQEDDRIMREKLREANADVR